MENRINAFKASPKAIKRWPRSDTSSTSCGLERPLLELVKMRASQINGCAYCLDMHSKDARALGETEQRLYALNAWRETPFYTERERAALEWTEAITLISEHPRAGRRLRASGEAVQPGGAREPDPGYRHHQQLEPALHRLPRRPRLLQIQSAAPEASA